MKKGHNILLTGLPRSGTTLACRLLNQLDDVVALQEPMRVGLFGKAESNTQIFEMIDGFIRETRRFAVEQGKIYTKNVNGKISDNFFQAPEDTDGIRTNISQSSYVKLEKEITRNLTVIIKHNAAFTALLPSLSSNYPVFAIIRNPLWVLASWNSNKMAVYEGHVPMGEQLDKKLSEDLASIPDRIDRQIHVLAWMFDQFSHLDRSHIIRYEDLVISRGKVLQTIIPQATQLNEPLSNEGKLERYPQAPLTELRKRLLNRGGGFFDFYSKESIVLDN